MFNINFNPFDNQANGMNELIIIEIQLGNQIVERNQLPSVFAKQQFAQIIQHLVNDSRPMLARAIRKNDNGKDDILEFKNNAFEK